MRLMVSLAVLVGVICFAPSVVPEKSSEPPSTAPPSLTAADSVRTFAFGVARDVTHQGPAAWRLHFSDSPSFFMASEGRLVFPDSESASKGIQQLEKMIRHIRLEWGLPIRVDSFAPGFAVLAMPYFEVREDTAGNRVEENGYFTGLAELRNGRWQFRNAHWSVPGPPRTVP